ncbi:MAG: hypothetical protein BGO07_00960 [Alphaproteobacteria bacterium 40-19]|nr:MAG: hypothetical protein BGO07_00960 [Alphaproteobacteria bacterium 40-19]
MSNKKNLLLLCLFFGQSQKIFAGEWSTSYCNDGSEAGRYYVNNPFLGKKYFADENQLRGAFFNCVNKGVGANIGLTKQRSYYHEGYLDQVIDRIGYESNIKLDEKNHTNAFNQAQGPIQEKGNAIDKNLASLRGQIESLKNQLTQASQNAGANYEASEKQLAEFQRQLQAFFPPLDAEKKRLGELAQKIYELNPSSFGALNDRKMNFLRNLENLRGNASYIDRLIEEIKKIFNEFNQKIVDAKVRNEEDRRFRDQLEKTNKPAKAAQDLLQKTAELVAKNYGVLYTLNSTSKEELAKDPTGNQKKADDAMKTLSGYSNELSKLNNLMAEWEKSIQDLNAVNPNNRFSSNIQESKDNLGYTKNRKMDVERQYAELEVLSKDIKKAIIEAVSFAKEQADNKKVNEDYERYENEISKSLSSISPQITQFLEAVDALSNGLEPRAESNITRQNIKEKAKEITASLNNYTQKFTQMKKIPDIFNPYANSKYSIGTQRLAKENKTALESMLKEIEGQINESKEALKNYEGKIKDIQKENKTDKNDTGARASIQKFYDEATIKQSTLKKDVGQLQTDVNLLEITARQKSTEELTSDISVLTKRSRELRDTILANKDLSLESIAKFFAPFFDTKYSENLRTFALEQKKRLEKEFSKAKANSDAASKSLDSIDKSLNDLKNNIYDRNSEKAQLNSLDTLLTSAEKSLDLTSLQNQATELSNSLVQLNVQELGSQSADEIKDSYTSQILDLKTAIAGIADQGDRALSMIEEVANSADSGSTLKSRAEAKVRDFKTLLSSTKDKLKQIDTKANSLEKTLEDWYQKKGSGNSSEAFGRGVREITEKATVFFRRLEKIKTIFAAVLAGDTSKNQEAVGLLTEIRDLQAEFKKLKLSIDSKASSYNNFSPDIQKSATVTAAFKQNQDNKDKLLKEESFVTNIEKKFEEVKEKANQSAEGSYQENKEKVDKSLKEMGEYSKIVERATKITSPAKGKSLNPNSQKLFEDAKNAFAKAKEEAIWIKGLGLKTDAQDTAEKNAAEKFNSLVNTLNKDIRTAFGKAKAPNTPTIEISGQDTIVKEDDKKTKGKSSRRRSSNRRHK